VSKVRNYSDGRHISLTDIQLSLQEILEDMATTQAGVLVYRSRYGTTQQYAGWIEKELRLPMIDPERLDDQVLTACNFLVIGTPVYLGEMLISDWLRQNEQRLRTRRLFLFIVCTHFSDIEKQQVMIKDNIPNSILATCELYFLPGRLIIENLSPEDARLIDLDTPPGTRLAKKDASMCYNPVQAGNIIPLVESVRSFI
jgi:menaquinone-dependent protoporphyrinogen IX oxidase